MAWTVKSVASDRATTKNPNGPTWRKVANRTLGLQNRPRRRAALKRPSKAIQTGVVTCDTGLRAMKAAGIASNFGARKCEAKCEGKCETRSTVVGTKVRPEVRPKVRPDVGEQTATNIMPGRLHPASFKCGRAFGRIALADASIVAFGSYPETAKDVSAGAHRHRCSLAQASAPQALRAGRF